MFAALNVDIAEKMSRRGNDRRRRECVLKRWKRGCPGRSRLEKRFGATDRAEWRAHAVGTDPECTAEWPGGLAEVARRVRGLPWDAVPNASKRRRWYCPTDEPGSQRMRHRG